MTATAAVNPVFSDFETLLECFAGRFLILIEGVGVNVQRGGGLGVAKQTGNGYLVYNSDGTMDVRSSSGGSAYRHYMLTASDGSSQQVYCVESGIAYNTSDNTYTSESGTNSNYLNLLPAEARRGITLTTIYGWKPGASLPVSGINEDDYKMATQIILWEYQQQLRSDPYSRHGNGQANADQYFSVIAGRPVEKAYNWILSQVASHSTVPSFTSTKKSEAPELELKGSRVGQLVIRACFVTSNRLKDKQYGLKYGRIGARELGKGKEKACSYGGGADV